MKVFIVLGTCGEYSDKSEWIITAYTTESDAKTHVEKATEMARIWMHDYYMVEKENPLDPNYRCSHVDHTYWFEEVDVQENFTASERIQ